MDQLTPIAQSSLEKLVAIADVGVAYWNVSSDEFAFSDKYCELLGYPPGTLEKSYRAWIASVFPDDQDLVAKSIQSHLERGTPVNVKCRIRLSRGDYRWFRICGQLNPTNQRKAGTMAIAIVDIDPIKQLENEIQNHRLQLKNLTLRVLERQESERKHIARELHDEIGQVLTAVKINLQSLKPSLAESPSAAKLVSSIAIVDELSAQVRNLSKLLRPPQLDALGLVAALSSYVENRIRPTGLIVNINCDPTLARLHADVETNCFRIVQEALTNILRHADATAVAIELRCFENQVVINIKDDGIGFDVGHVAARTARGECLGLFGMEERAELLGGQVKFFSRENEGTNIEVRLPLLLAKPRGRSKLR